FGFIHESIRQLMLRKYSQELWQEVLTRSGFESGKENIINHYYSDADTYMLVDSVAVLTKMSREQVWELYGSFLIEYTMEIGWDELIRNMSPDLKSSTHTGEPLTSNIFDFNSHVPKELLVRGTPIMRIFEVNRPQIPIDFDNICNFINAVFVLQVKTSPTDMRRQQQQPQEE
ncbi:heme NO binding protein, partial [Teladorsagia circumcincta]